MEEIERIRVYEPDLSHHSGCRSFDRIEFDVMMHMAALLEPPEPYHLQQLEEVRSVLHEEDRDLWAIVAMVERLSDIGALTHGVEFLESWSIHRTSGKDHPWRRRLTSDSPTTYEVASALVADFRHCCLSEHESLTEDLLDDLWSAVEECSP